MATVTLPLFITEELPFNGYTLCVATDMSDRYADLEHILVHLRDIKLAVKAPYDTDLDAYSLWIKLDRPLPLSLDAYDGWCITGELDLSTVEYDHPAETIYIHLA